MMLPTANPLIIGHRGAPLLAPENTPESFARALELGVDGVELDVHLTADREPVVFHDVLLDAATTGRGPIGFQTRRGIAALRLRKAAKYGIASFDEVLDVVANKGVELQIELKTDYCGNAYQGMADIVLGKLRERRVEGSVLLTSFSPAVLSEVAALRPGTGLLASLNATSAAALSGFKCMMDAFRSLPGCILAINKGMLQYCLDNCAAWPGLDRIGVWTPNSLQDLDFWLGSGVRHLVTNDVKLAVETARARQASLRFPGDEK